MEKRHKDILRPLVADLRRLLAGTADGTRRGDLDRELERLGIAPDGGITLLDALPTLSPAERRTRQVAEAELQQVADAKARPTARAAFIERAAYGWINRLLALRVLEARGLIDETLRANPAYDGLPEALYLLRQGEPGRAAGPDGGWWAVIEDACAAQAAALPGLFSLEATPQVGEARRTDDTLRDPAIALRPSTAALLDCVALLGDAQAGTPQGRVEEVRTEMDAAFADPDAIGWAYQFYQEEAKAQVYLRLKAGKKVVTRDEIAVATQLFTEPSMVKWLLQNSLGRSYHEAYPQSTLPATWEYYIRPERLDTPAFTTLAGLTLMDPCMGSGHFLREAFDIFVAMYREQQPGISATEIADRILGEHLHGIDIDPRAAGLSAFTLYARAWELVRDERRAKRQVGAGTYKPTAMNLATTPDRIAPGALVRHLQRHPEDRMLEPLLKGVFAALEQADILGSLLRPREQLQAAIAELRKVRQLGLGTPEELDLQSAIDAVAQSDPAHLEEMLLDRVAAGFAVEARGAGNVSAQLFGRAAERGVRLLQLLDRPYAVVVTNPPYMSGRNMANELKHFVEQNYAPGRRDLYSAFILRCMQLAGNDGRLGMVTMHGWMFLSSFVELRVGKSGSSYNESFSGVLRQTNLEGLVHLGRYAFAEIGNAVVAPVLFTCQCRRYEPVPLRTFWACRLTAPRPSEQQDALLLRAVRGKVAGCTFRPIQDALLSIPQSPIVYWLRPHILELLRNSPRLRDIADVRVGLSSADNDRFTRCFWEVPHFGVVTDGRPKSGRWFRCAKGGGYQKWIGLEWLVVNWEYDGASMKATSGAVIRNDHYYFISGLTYTMFARGSLALRTLENSAFEYGSISLFPHTKFSVFAIMVSISNRFASYLARVVTQDLKIPAGYIEGLPLPATIDARFDSLGKSCVSLKRHIVARNLLEREFSPDKRGNAADYTEQALLHTLEGLAEYLVREAYGLDEEDVASIIEETSTPVGWFPLFAGYDVMPGVFNDLVLPNVLKTQFASHERLNLLGDELKRLRVQVRLLYEAGPGVKEALDEQEAVSTNQGDDDLTTIGGYLPIPPETFLEELSQKLQIHPISVYWLLREIRAEGFRCRPEERRLLEDRISVLVLRLLGYRWPKQVEANERVPNWADRDGIIPLLPGAGERTLAERLRERLRDEDGNLGAQQAEALLTELTGRSLEDWLRRDFFPRHVRQFKYRPIAWHLASVPDAASGKGKSARGKGGARQAPAFECVVYYHATGTGMLARIRTQYLEPLLRAERGREDAARKANDDTVAAQAHARVAELEAFAMRLRHVEEEGFACPELDAALASEPLDSWSGDGILAPASHEELLSRERAWTVDINDGVRVNIAPLQLAGVLAADVLKEADARKAITDRVRWRADERRWVREGILPRCGWMSEEIPESRRWVERAPEREAERAKLEAKRAEALRELERADDQESFH